MKNKEEIEKMRSDFSEFVDLSGAEHWKDELEAVIHVDDLNRFAKAVHWYTGSMLQGVVYDNDTQLVEVYAQGYRKAGLVG
jgi:hypothetical protein